MQNHKMVVAEVAALGISIGNTKMNITEIKVDGKIKDLIRVRDCWYNIPTDLLERKYRGCGNGFVIIDKPTGKVVSMEYTEDGEIVDEQNIFMSEEAGNILSETETELCLS